MRRMAGSIFATAALVWAIAVSQQARGADDKSFQGEIADSQCAMNVHSLSQSHKEMIEMNSGIKTGTDCALFCVKERGGRYVLQTKNKVYRLDNQDLAERSAGLKVKVTGTLDPKTDTITIHSIELLSPDTSKPSQTK